MVSMNKLKELAPKLTELKEKYKGDAQKLNIHMMELYKKDGANPMGGCLPMLLQIPIFFAIYRVLLNSIELKGAAWILWIHDLSLMDQYYVLPILMGGSMFVQQLITPQNFTDPLQAKIFKYLPVVFTFFFLAFPAGLTLYWFVNNLLSIIQQYTVNYMMAKKHTHKVVEGA
jgi:YidC/Oxa1 family membrane protein insertase